MITESMAIILGNTTYGRFSVTEVLEIPNIKKRTSGRFIIYDYDNEYPEFENNILKKINNDKVDILNKQYDNFSLICKEKRGRFMIYG